MLSYEDNIPTILSLVKGKRNILDIGSGIGKYGLLLREQYLSSQAENGSLQPIDDIRIDCCEYTPYFYCRQDHRFIYNNHYHKSMFELSDEALNQYEIVLLIDVIEHWDKKVVQEFLKRIKVPVLISTPKETVMYQDEFYGDKAHHKTQWDITDFNTKDLSTRQSLICILNNEEHK